MTDIRNEDWTIADPGTGEIRVVDPADVYEQRRTPRVRLARTAEELPFVISTADRGAGFVPAAKFANEVDARMYVHTLFACVCSTYGPAKFTTEGF